MNQVVECLYFFFVLRCEAVQPLLIRFEVLILQISVSWLLLSRTVLDERPHVFSVAASQ